MPAFNDLTGKQINYWKVISRASNEGTSTRWHCVCECGTARIVRAAHLATDASKSCGCREPIITSHGQARDGNFTKKYKTWRSIRARCLNPNHKNANIYNELLYEEWMDFKAFDRDVPAPPVDSLTIDRIENSKGYEPGNVRWVTMAEQHRNQSNCRWIDFGGKTQLMSEWAKEIGITPASLFARIEKYGIEIALSTPKTQTRVDVQPN